MTNTLKKLLSAYAKMKGYKKGLVTGLMAVVVFVTTYSLILPAITLSHDDREYSCLFVVHEHTDDCYEEQPDYDAEGRQIGKHKVLICQKADYAVHEHDENCYQTITRAVDEDGKEQNITEKVLVCQLPEIKEHKHDKDCYTKQKVLTCGMAESQGHTHTDSCYTETQQFDCSQEEHTHTDACYSDVVVGTDKELVCGYDDGEVITPEVWSEPEYSEPVIDDETGEVLEEAQLIHDAELIQEAVVHHHDDSCYRVTEETERQLTCGKKEHTHDASCYRTERTLNCGLAEGASHTHTASCYTEQEVLTCKELVLHRHTMDCYEKGPKDESPEDMGWAWYTEDEWGNKIVDGDPHHLICGQIELLAHQHNDACYTVAVEDADVPLAMTPDESESDVEETLDTNETETETETETESEQEMVPAAFNMTIPVEGADYQLILNIGKECGIPKEATFKAVAIKEDTADYDAYAGQAAEAVAQEQDKDAEAFQTIALFDLSIYDAEGNEIQPQAPISVTIDLGSAPADNNASELYAVHFPGTSLDEDGNVTTAAPETKETEAEETEETDETEATETNDTSAPAEPEVKTLEENDGKVNFDAESFSVYAVVYKQLQTYVISDSGDTYEVIVTYDDSAEIPADAELRVREIKSTEEEYTKNVKATNKELDSQNAPEVEQPVQFDIAIISDGVEIEPKEGSIVKVEIRLVSDVFGAKTEDMDSRSDNAKAEMEEGEIWFNGTKFAGTGEDVDPYYTVSHIADDGTADIIEEVNAFNEEEKIVLQFETEAFSTYLVDTSNTDNLSHLPNKIYVGDVIYLYDHSNYTINGSGYTDVHINNNGKFREIRATSTGTFTITSPAWTEYTMWGQVYHPAETKTIAVQSARTGTTPPATIDTVDNATIGLTMNLFDYDLDNSLDSYFNNFNQGDNPVSAAFLNENNSINNGHALKFWGSGIGDNYGSANKFDSNLVKSIVQSDLAGGIGGYPRLKSNSNPWSSTESLEYLFSPSSGTDKEAYKNVNHLFKKQGDYFVYDSNENYAYYDKSQGDSGNFTVYERTYEQKSMKNGGEQAQNTNGKSIGFFPFHKWDDEYDQYTNWDKTLNHHFGLAMSVPFSMPKAPKAVQDSNQKDIIFEFSGDDDLWVFIDGKLAMDIGGIHQPTSGTINFTQKTVTVNNQSQSFDFSKLYDGKKHTLQVFYLERGGADSNCKIMFNLTQYGDVEFDKVDADDNSVLLPGAVFGLYKDANCTQPLTEKLDAQHGGITRSFTVETDENGHAILKDIPLGDYYLKEIHAPDGYPITIGAEAAHVHVYLDSSGNVKVSVNNVESGVKITNKKPSPINLGVKKEWQNEDEQTIPAPDGVTAAFKIKRMRTYDIYTEEIVEGEGRQSSHLTVGWLHDGQTYEYEEFDLVAGSRVTVSWSYAEGYDGIVGYRLNGEDNTKPSVPTNVYAQGFDMPAAGQNAFFYIVDNSETGEAITNINVAGSQFYGNSGGGYIHTFHQITEPDSEFTYTDTDNNNNVTDNTVTLPINESTWQYIFNNLPTFENGSVNVAIEEGEPEENYDVVFHYSYYLEEVSSTAPDGTTVIYKDLNGNEINSPADAETSVSGTETIINRVPFGYLKIKKEVTYNGSSNNLTTDQKSKLAGTYKFKIYTKQQCGVADAVQDPHAPEDAEDKDLIITITIGENGQAVSSDPIKLLAGNYWIKEVESSNPMMFPVANPITAPVTKDNTTNNAVISSLTNNYDENNGPDKISIDIEKKFQGLDSITQIPAEFQITLQYKIGNETKTCTLGNGTTTGQNGETITFTTKDDGFIWHWHVGNIDPEAEEFKIKESNYNKAKGYDWKKAFLDTVVTTGNEVVLNTIEITDTVDNWHNLNITAPKAVLSDVTNDRRTSDSHSNTEFYLDDTDVLLSKLTGDHGNTVTLVISKHPLNLMERDAVKKGLPNQFKNTCVFYSIDEHPNGFQFQSGKDNKKVTFGVKNGRTTVKFTQAASAQESVWLVNYSSQAARNNANLVNTYEEIPITIDIIKVDEKDSSKRLPGAIFTLRQIADVAPVNGELRTLDETDPIDSDETDDNGKTSFGNLTHGYYEITEKTAPDGYIKSEEITSYFKIENGVVKWLVKGNNKPSEWAEKTEKGDGELVDFDKAHAAVEANPELNIEAQPATNAVFTVENKPGAALPNTGGPGTHLFYMFGAILALMGGAALILRRRTIR